METVIIQKREDKILKKKIESVEEVLRKKFDKGKMDKELFESLLLGLQDIKAGHITRVK
ncbi:MAG: hypothetical protein Q7R96_06360 [Nanoarchaeota archaeon]|nr:hypothetical protein [Nanoarchaeota archaeon]